MSRILILFALLGLCAAAALLALIRCAWAILTNQSRAWSIILMCDRLGNAAANDDSGQLASSRAYLARRDGKRWGKWLADALDAIEPGHCLKSYESDLKLKSLGGERSIENK